MLRAVEQMRKCIEKKKNLGFQIDSGNQMQFILRNFQRQMILFCNVMLIQDLVIVFIFSPQLLHFPFLWFTLQDRFKWLNLEQEIIKLI